MPAPGCTTLTIIRPIIQRDGTDNLEVQQGNRPRTPDRLHAFHASDTGHHGTEMTGAMIILMSLTNASPSGFIRAPSPVVVTEQNTDGDGCRDLEVKTLKSEVFIGCPRKKTTGFVRLWLTCGFKITPT